MSVISQWKNVMHVDPWLSETKFTWRIYFDLYAKQFGCCQLETQENKRKEKEHKKRKKEKKKFSVTLLHYVKNIFFTVTTLYGWVFWRKNILLSEHPISLFHHGLLMALMLHRCKLEKCKYWNLSMFLSLFRYFYQQRED